MNRIRSAGRPRLGISVAIAVAGIAIAALAPAAAGELADVELGRTAIKWSVKGDFEKTVLVVSGPQVDLQREFAGGETPVLEVESERWGRLPDGGYAWELRAVPRVSPETREKLAEAREAMDRGERVDPRELGLPRDPLVESGYFTIRDGAIRSDREREPEGERQQPDAVSRIPGDLEVAGSLRVRGTKNFVVPDPADGDRVLVYAALEGPEAGTYYRGTARTRGGVAAIELPEHFAATTEPEGLTVQLTPLGGWSRLYVAEKSPRRLVVRTAPGGAAADEVEFDFLVQGVRKGYAGYRVERPR